MSGTSIDGVDAVLARFDCGRFLAIEATHTRRYPARLRERLLAVSTQARPLTLADFATLDAAVGEVFTQTAVELIAASGLAPRAIRAIGSHGQTIFHDPLQAHNSLQIGDANRIAAGTGICTVADFRRRDLASGGHGAPLVPAFHHAVFARPQEALCVANIGGIANVTRLDGAELSGVSGFDTGPGNGLMDEWIKHRLGRDYDADGAWAASGQVHPELLQALLGDPWFTQSPPKSTGRDAFNLAWVRRRFPTLDALLPATVQRTLCELTALSLAEAARGCTRLLVCGGGAHNGFLLSRLRALFGKPVESTAACGLDPQWVEAAAFAWLALRRLDHLPGNVPAVTGARHPVILGAIYAP